MDGAFAAVVAAGATEVAAPADHWRGGRSGYFADPAGNPWEIVWIPDAARDERGALVIASPLG